MMCRFGKVVCMSYCEYGGLFMILSLKMLVFDWFGYEVIVIMFYRFNLDVERVNVVYCCFSENGCVLMIFGDEMFLLMLWLFFFIFELKVFFKVVLVLGIWFWILKMRE